MNSLSREYDRQHCWRSFSDAYDLLGDMIGAKVVDVGCGTGSVILDLHNRGFEMIGVDANEELVKYAREKLPPECVVAVRDFEEPHLWPRKPYDIIWSSFAIAYANEPIRTLRGWRKNLKKGGKLVLIEINELLSHRPMDQTDKDAISNFYEEAYKMGHYNFRAGSCLGSWVEEAGFKIEKSLQLSDAELSFDGPAQEEVVMSWQNRFLRMPKLTSMVPDGFESRFIQTLKDEAHVSECSVNLILATNNSDQI